MKSVIKCLLVGLTFLWTSQLYAQEVTVSASTQIYGYIDDAFAGFGLGIEAPASTKSSLVFNLNIGSQERGTAIEFRSSWLYYFGSNHTCFFLGPSLKYISLKEPDNKDDFLDTLYALGFSTGYKVSIGEKLRMHLILNPHVTVGERTEGNVAGISAQVGLGYLF